MLHEPIKPSPTVQEAVSAFADNARSMTDLRVLQRVDDTVEALVVERRFYASHASMGRMITETIQHAPATRDNYLDPEYALDDVLEKLVKHNDTASAKLRDRKACIDADGRLKTHHCDQLHTAYDDLLRAIAEDTGVAERIAGALVTHDLAVEPRDGQTHDSVTKLHNAIANG